ncbi:lysophospholipid acyltransferase family protein [Geomonas sp. RF6]|uniref:lysophospholipid acyltransferase family protein n=1 Tax=Geomonas sp. RF6 TaxID=2897342 RepID=UPI001E65D899|nr:lysophospholipid acyltransferase family protein [Geomonas sp. RF6]UFS69372.1 lysophospholipid acyltransferase family protein [Geomonas sp. RF6]
MAASNAQQPGKKWTSRSIGADWQHRVFYTLIRFGGRWAADFLLVFVVLYYTLFRPSVRNRSMHYLRRRFPRHGTLGLWWGSYRMSFGVGRVLVDRAVLGILGPQYLSVSLEARAALAALLAEGRGLILVTAHVGCWQLAMSSLSHLGSAVSLVMHREEGDVDRQFFEHGGGEAPYRFIDPATALGGSLEMLQVLKNGEVLSIMGDRMMGGKRSCLSVPFLGDPIEVPFSPYMLGSATGAPVAVIFPHTVARGKYGLQVARVMRVPEGLGRRGEAYRPYAEEFVRALEEFVEERPYQFFNFYDMWAPVGPVGLV